MKFGEQYHEFMVSAWKDRYVDYERLKTLIVDYRQKKEELDMERVARVDPGCCGGVGGSCWAALAALLHDGSQRADAQSDAEQGRSRLPTGRSSAFAFEDVASLRGYDEDSEQREGEELESEGGVLVAQVAKASSPPASTASARTSLGSLNSERGDQVNTNHDECCPPALLTLVREFSEIFHAEVSMAWKFVGERQNGLERRLREIDTMFHALQDDGQDGTASKWASPASKKRQFDHTRRTLELAHKRADEIARFRELNFMACVKILKKFRKTIKTLSDVDAHMQPLTDRAKCLKFDDTLQRLKEDAIRIYSHFVCGGLDEISMSTARGKLQFGLQHSARPNIFRYGLRVGLAIAFIIWFVWNCAVDSARGVLLWNDPVLHIYTVMGNIVLLFWLAGASMWMWERAHINYWYFFGVSPRRSLRPLHVFSVAAMLTILLAVNTLLYYKARRGQNGPLEVIPAWVYPLAAAASLAIFFVRALVRSQLLRATFYNVLIAPFGTVDFIHAYLGDVLTSMVRVFSDVVLSCCFMFTGDIVKVDDTDDMTYYSIPQCNSGSIPILVSLSLLLPLWFRFAQCIRKYTETRDRFPHLANALKYALAQTVVLFGVFHPELNDPGEIPWARTLYLILFVTATLYQFYWDIAQDWGLLYEWHHGGDSNSNSNSNNKAAKPCPFLLRPHRMYRKRWIYYAAMVADLLMRFAWTMGLVPAGTQLANGVAFQDQLAPFLAAIELTRRTMWGFFRLENEQVKQWAAEADDADGEVPDFVLVDKSGVNRGASRTSTARSHSGSQYNRGAAAAAAAGRGGTLLQQPLLEVSEVSESETDTTGARADSRANEVGLEASAADATTRVARAHTIPLEECCDPSHLGDKYDEDDIDLLDGQSRMERTSVVAPDADGGQPAEDGEDAEDESNTQMYIEAAISMFVLFAIALVAYLTAR